MRVPVELAFILMILAFGAGYGLRAVISKVHHAREARRSIDSFSDKPTASSRLLGWRRKKAAVG